MSNEPERGANPAPGTTYSRRDVLKGTLAASAGALALTAFGGAAQAPEAGAQGLAGTSQAADEFLPSSKFTIKNTIALNLTKHFATAPLHEGRFNGKPVWYIITEASDAAIARDLGLNFAPRLANIPAGHPAVQEVVSANPILGRDMVTFAGAPDFSPMRIVTPGPKGFPPARFQPGAFADAKYSDLVRVKGSGVVYNAPIVAVGPGPFDVVTHRDTHDRLLGIDTVKMTADMLLVRAFAHGKDIFYHSFSASNPLAAPIERGTFIPALAEIDFRNSRTLREGARSAIFAFVNGQTGPNSPPAQGLNHVILDAHGAEDASLQNPALLEALRAGGDAHNVLDSFTTLVDPALAMLYTPLWDLQLVRWSDAAVAQGLNVAQKDGNQIRQLAARGMVTADDGLPLVPVNIIVNCPIVAFFDAAPDVPQAPDPGRAATLFSGAP